MNPVSTLCIPRMESCFKLDYVISKIVNLKIGTIESIKEIPLKNEPSHKRIIMQIRWNEEPNTENIKTRLNKNDSIKIVYDDKWYWKLLLAKFTE